MIFLACIAGAWKYSSLQIGHIIISSGFLLRWRYTGRFARIIFSATQRCNVRECCNNSRQCRSNIATLCCAKNRRCKSSRVTHHRKVLSIAPFRVGEFVAALKKSRFFVNVILWRLILLLWSASLLRMSLFISLIHCCNSISLIKPLPFYAYD